MCYAPIPRVLRAVEKARTTADDVEALAEALYPSIAKVIAKALQDQSDALDLDALADALMSGDLNAVFTILDGMATKMGIVTASLQDAMWAGGALAATAINLRLTGVLFEFDRLNPKLIQWLQTYSLGLIREINTTTKEGVRTALIDGMASGKNPRVQAKEIKQVVGLTRRQSQAVANFRRELETFHMKRSAKGWGLGSKIDRVNGAQVLRPGEGGKPKDGILERRLRDFRHDKTLQRALNEGKALTPAQVDKMVEAYTRKYRKYRGETIARTEAMRTLNMGVQEAWRQSIEDGTVAEALVRRYWKVGKDERTCDVCNAVPGMNPKGVKLAQPFKTPKGPYLMGPLHPDCRCHLFIRMHEPEELPNL